MDKKRLFTSLALIALAVLMLVEAGKLPAGTLRAPDAGLWPTILGSILAVLACVHLAMTLKGFPGEGAPFWAEPGIARNIVLVLVPTFACCFVFERLGFLISIFLLLGFLLRVLRPMPWRWVFVTAALCSILPYFIFKNLLGVDLPVGILGL